MEKYTFECPNCGATKHHKHGHEYICDYCGYTETVRFEQEKRTRPIEGGLIEYFEQHLKDDEFSADAETATEQKQAEQASQPAQNDSRFSKILHGFFGEKLFHLVICLLFGILGVHKFVKGDAVGGLVYLFTVGFFGIGYVFDVIGAVFDYLKGIFKGLFG